MSKIKVLKPTDIEYLLRDEKKVLVIEKRGIVIGRGINSLMKVIDSKKINHFLNSEIEDYGEFD